MDKEIEEFRDKVAWVSATRGTPLPGCDEGEGTPPGGEVAHTRVDG